MAETARDRLVRMLGIVTYLDTHGDVPFTELAEHFGVTVTQIRRDILTLWTSGLPGYMPDDLLDFDAIAFDADIASLTQGHGVTQVRLSTREAVALVGSLSTVASAGVASAFVEGILAKLKDALSEPVIVLPGDAPADPAVHDSLVDAIRRARRARVTYVDALDRRTVREVDPHRIVVIDGHAYLECYCRRAQDYRTLRLDRMAQVEVLSQPTEHPPTDTAGFRLQATVDATVRLSRAGRLALEDIQGVTFEDAEEEVVARFGVTDLEWVAGRLLSIAPHLREVQPPSLARAVREQARAVASAQRG